VFQLAPQDLGVKLEKPGGRAPKARVSSAVGARIEVPRGVGIGCTCKTFSIFWAQKDDLWCILGAIFAVEWKLVRPLSGTH